MDIETNKFKPLGQLQVLFPFIGFTHVYASYAKSLGFYSAKLNFRTINISIMIRAVERTQNLRKP